MPATVAISRAAQTLVGGGVVAYPTEAVFGLGCDPRNEAALKRLLTLKQRDAGKGFILIAANAGQLEPYILPLPATAERRVRATWPGPVTWVYPAKRSVSALLRGSHDTLAVRVTGHPVAAAICEAFRGALVSTSANIAGREPARSAAEVRAAFGRGVDMVLEMQVTLVGGPTEIRDAQSGKVIRAR
ncbi:MAG: L-threonylcarbamoyladenylate synthase [Gammaproteobacteria bacterium]